MHHMLRLPAGKLALVDAALDAGRRVSTSCLLALLCVSYPRALVVFVSLLMLDIFSHWFQMYSTLLAGSSTHKVGPTSWQLAAPAVKVAAAGCTSQRCAAVLLAGIGYASCGNGVMLQQHARQQMQHSASSC
jgi:hypothetical protein